MYIYIYTHIYTHIYIYVYIFGCIKTHVKQLMFLFLCVNAGSELQPKFQRHTKFSVQRTARLPIHCLRCSSKWLFPNRREVNTSSVWLGLR